MSINDPKYKFENGRIINEASGEPVPLDEPCMVFRARDIYAINILETYLQVLAMDDDVDTSHRQAVLAVLERLNAFAEFQSNHPDRIKIPDTDHPLAMARQVEGRELEFARMSDGTIKVGYNPRTEEGGWGLVGDVTKAVTAIEAQRDQALRALDAAKHRLDNVRTVLIDGDERTALKESTSHE